MNLEFFEKFKENILKINEVSLQLMKYGTQFAMGVILIGLATYLINYRQYIFNYLGEQYGIHIMIAGVSLFVQFVIGGLVLDIVQKRRQN